MIQHYSNMGIDIFNREDLFFNELCYPFSLSNSDNILKAINIFFMWKWLQILINRHWKNVCQVFFLS